MLDHDDTDLMLVMEQSTAYLEVPLYDRNGVESVPTSATFTVHDVESGTEVVASTALTPAATLNVPLRPVDNRILHPASRRERRRITVRALYGVDDQLVVVQDYIVVKAGFLAT